MSDVILSPNMNLPVPTVGVDPGPDWANNINASLSILDQHNHTSGSGVPITPSAININSDLSINSNNVTVVRTVRFDPQPAALSGGTDLGCLYESGVDLYYNDGSGNQVRITQGGSVTGSSGTITGLPSGTASASFAAGTFTFQRATNTSATIDAGSYVMRLNSSGSNGLTLSPPSSLSGGSYGLTFPSIPSVTSIMALDASGNITAPYTVDNSTIDINGSNQIEVKANGITAAQIANQTITESQLQLRPTGTTAGIGGMALSVSSASFSGTGTLTGILSVTLTTSGRPVMLQLVDDGSGNTSQVFSDVSALIRFNRDAVQLTQMELAPSTAGESAFYPCSSIGAMDFPVAGTYVYTLNALVVGTLTLTAVKMLAYEI